MWLKVPGEIGDVTFSGDDAREVLEWMEGDNALEE